MKSRFTKKVEKINESELFLKELHIFIFLIIFLILTQGYIIDSRERRRKIEKNVVVKETTISCLNVPKQGTEPISKACALNGNQTCSLLV